MKKTYQIFIVLTLSLATVLFVTNSYALTNTTTGSAKPVKLARQEIAQKEKSSQEIDRRITSLNKLISRLTEMKKLNDVDKSLLISQTQEQINRLNTLKIKIGSDEDQQSLKSDRQSIYNQYRIYLTFMPKIQVLAAVDRITEISTDMGLVIPKLTDRISREKQGGKDVSALEGLMADLQNKLADANIQAKAARDLVTPLVSDEGDLNIAKSNLEALKNARAKLVLAKKDLSDATADIQKIKAGLTRDEKIKVATTSADRR